MDADNNKAGSWGRLRVATSLKSIGGISLFLFCVLVRNVHITSIESSDQKNISTAVESTAAEKKAPPTNHKPKDKIVLLGERHSGTNWITDHLEACFQSSKIEVSCCCESADNFTTCRHIHHEFTYLCTVPLFFIIVGDPCILGMEALVPRRQHTKGS